MSTQLNILLGEGGTPVNATSKFFTGQVLGQANNRLYRQHRTYVQRVSLLPSTNATLGTPLKVFALSTKWTVMSALMEARAQYERAMKEERADSGMSRWHDFRISADMTANTLQAFGANHNTFPAATYAELDNGEYDSSSVRDAAGNDRLFVINGSTSTARYNVFEEFDQQGRTSAMPDTADSGGYDDIISAVDPENVQHLLDAGNLPPYQEQNNPRSGLWCEVAQLYRDPSGHVLSTGYFEAPLGLIIVEGVIPTQDEPFLRLEVKAGKYKGVDSQDIPARVKRGA
jgi:hypothetical protein